MADSPTPTIEELELEFRRLAEQYAADPASMPIKDAMNSILSQIDRLERGSPSRVPPSAG